jgi:hypothetical protein
MRKTYNTPVLRSQRIQLGVFGSYGQGGDGGHGHHHGGGGHEHGHGDSSMPQPIRVVSSFELNLD